MKVFSILALTGLASAINTRGSRGAALERKGIKLPHRSAPKQASKFAKRDGNSTIIPQNAKTESTYNLERNSIFFFSLQCRS